MIIINTGLRFVFADPLAKFKSVLIGEIEICF